MAKAGRPKAGSSKLPDWFDIEKYRDTSNFGADGWFEQLAFRRVLLNHYQVFLSQAQREDAAKIEASIAAEWGTPNEADSEVEVFEASEKQHDPRTEAWHNLCKLLWEHPIVTPDRIEDACAYRNEKGILLHDMNEANSVALALMEIRERGVREVTNQEIYDVYCAFPYRVRKTLETNRDSFHGELAFLNPSSPMTPILSEAYKFLGAISDAPRIALDLSLPNSIILRQVEEFLNEKRKQLGQVTRAFLKGPDFGDWYNCGLLPYLDLLLWERITREPIYWSVFISALTDITDRPIGGESALRKTTRGHAEKILTPQAMMILHIQAAGERSGTLEKSGKLLLR